MMCILVTVIGFFGFNLASPVTLTWRLIVAYTKPQAKANAAFFY